MAVTQGQGAPRSQPPPPAAGQLVAEPDEPALSACRPRAWAACSPRRLVPAKHLGLCRENPIKTWDIQLKTPPRLPRSHTQFHSGSGGHWNFEIPRCDRAWHPAARTSAFPGEWLWFKVMDHLS